MRSSLSSVDEGGGTGVVFCFDFIVGGSVTGGDVLGVEVIGCCTGLPISRPCGGDNSGEREPLHLRSVCDILRLSVYRQAILIRHGKFGYKYCIS